jgi:hypothetical protein
MVAVIVLAILVGFFVVSLFLKRHGESELPAGDWARTDEVFVDPSTGRRMRVDRPAGWRPPLRPGG